MNFKAWLIEARNFLAVCKNSKREAEILLGFVTGKTRGFIIAFTETELTLTQLEQLNHLLKRRKSGEPIAYLVGEKEFWSLPLQVSADTLIPRPETERLVELALEKIPLVSSDILDLGTGTGAIALALAKERKDCTVYGIDITPEVVHLAESNAKRLAITNSIFQCSDWFSALKDRRFSIIVSNPPYIAQNDPHLQQDGVYFEPYRALVSAENGLADIQYIIAQAPHYLLSEGWLLLEHGWQQGKDVRYMMNKRGFIQVMTHKDHGGNERVTLGCWRE